LYQPQFGHTTWGDLAAAQLGQVERAGRSRRQLAARRERERAFEVLRLGTGIVLASSVVAGPNFGEANGPQSGEGKV
jgi:hypothetical protein